MALWLVLASIGATVAYRAVVWPDASRLPLPLAGTTQKIATSEFDGIENLQTIQISNPDAEALSGARVDLLAALRDKKDVYEIVFAPGAHDFYDDYGLLFRPLDEVKARVVYALSLLPLFTAIAEAPNAGGMTTLVNEIAGAVQQGRTSQGVTDLMNEAAASVQALVRGEDRPLDWAKIADLVIPETSQTATILALPKPGQEEAARSLTDRVLGVLRDSSSTRAEFSQSAAPAAKERYRKSGYLRIAAALCIGAAFVFLLVAIFIGRLQMIVVIALPAFVVLWPLLAVIMVADGRDWLSFWPVIFAAVFGTLVMSLHKAFLLVDQFGGTEANQSGAMLVDQLHGARLVWLTLTYVSPWLALGLMQQGLAFWALALLVLTPIVSYLCVMTLSVALLRLSPSALQWRAGEWLEPLHRTLFENAQWKVVAPVLGGIILLASIVFAVVAPSGQKTTLSDAAVSVIATDTDEAGTIISRLGSFSEAKSVRWIGMFVPDQAAEKRALLHELVDKFPRITPVQSEAPSDLHEQVDTMQDSLRRIADQANSDKELVAAAAEFRRSLALLAAMGTDQPLTQLENRLFGGFNRLADRASQLAALPPVEIDALPPELQRLFGHGAGPYRLAVEPADGVSNAKLALTLDQAGFAVLHPAVDQSRTMNQNVRTLFLGLSLALGLLLVTLVATFRNLRAAFGALTMLIVASVMAIGLQTIWAPALNLSWLLAALALLSSLGAFLHLAIARYEASAVSAVEMFMLPLVALALVIPFFALEITAVATEAVPIAICLIGFALLVGLFHHHSRATQAAGNESA